MINRCDSFRIVELLLFYHSWNIQIHIPFLVVLWISKCSKSDVWTIHVFLSLVTHRYTCMFMHATKFHKHTSFTPFSLSVLTFQFSMSIFRKSLLCFLCTLWMWLSSDNQALCLNQVTLVINCRGHTPI